MNASKVPYDASEFAGKRVLVTGGTKGIGEAIVIRLRRGGGTVLATAITMPAGGNAERFIQADASTRVGADEVIKSTFDRLGGLDILINNLGGSSAPGGGALALTDDIWQQEFELNLFSAVRLDSGAIADWADDDKARFVGYLPQDIELFHASVRDNIARFSDATDDDVIAAATLAGAHEMILPYD